jgi:hypothetical protein
VCASLVLSSKGLYAQIQAQIEAEERASKDRAEKLVHCNMFTVSCCVEAHIYHRPDLQFVHGLMGRQNS